MEIWRLARESNWNQTCSIFSETLYRLIQDSSRSRRSRSDVPATKCVLDEGYVSETCWSWWRLRKSCHNVSATLRRRLRDSEPTSSRQRLTYFYRPRKEIINQRKSKTYIYLENLNCLLIKYVLENLKFL